MYTRILVPLDGSKRAEAILPHVEELAFRFDAELILLRVVEPEPTNVRPEGPYSSVDSSADFQRRMNEARSYLNALHGEFRAKGIEGRVHVLTGAITDTIINVAADEQVDLIAMASHGRSGLAQVFYGSVAAGVLQRVDRPLLLIRSRGES